MASVSYLASVVLLLPLLQNFSTLLLVLKDNIKKLKWSQVTTERRQCGKLTAATSQIKCGHAGPFVNTIIHSC